MMNLATPTSMPPKRSAHRWAGRRTQKPRRQEKLWMEITLARSRLVNLRKSRWLLKTKRSLMRVLRALQRLADRKYQIS